MEASSTVSRSGSFGTKNGMSGDEISGATPSVQNSGLRRLWILAIEFLLFLRVALSDPEDDALIVEPLPALFRLALLEFSSTGR